MLIRYGGLGLGDNLKGSYNDIMPYSAVGIKLTIPILNFFKRNARYKQAEINRINAEENLRMSEGKYRVEYENVYTKLLQAQANMENDRRNVTLGETTLQRIDRMGSITVQANVIDRPTGTVSDEIKAKAQSIKVPNGISIEYLGDSKNQGDAFGSLGLAFITAIILVYLIMVALYENAVYPFVVLFSIPVALVGALLVLALTMETLNIFTIIGMIMLLGLVAKNAILIVDFTNKLKEEGYGVKEALVEAGKERLRPILRTTLAMIFGMLPIAMAGGAASEIKNGMAWES